MGGGLIHREGQRTAQERPGEVEATVPAERRGAAEASRCAPDFSNRDTCMRLQSPDSCSRGGLQAFSTAPWSQPDVMAGWGRALTHASKHQEL